MNIFVFLFFLAYVNVCLSTKDAQAALKISNLHSRSLGETKVSLQSLTNVMAGQEAIISDVKKTLEKTDTPTTRSNYSTSQRTAIINRYNYHRRLIGAKEMEVLTWNQDLASAMDAQYQRCYTTDPMPPFSAQPGRAYNTTSTVAYGDEGEDVLVTTSLLEEIVDFLFSGSPYYNLENNTCSPGFECNDYRTVAEWTVTEVGCAYQECWHLDGFPLNRELVLINCLYNYDASRQIGIHPPYEEGPQTTTATITTTTPTTAISSSTGSAIFHYINSWIFMIFMAILVTTLLMFDYTYSY